VTVGRGRGTVVVEAPARLHFGMLDLSGARGRRFGGVGAAIPEPSTLVSAGPAPALRVEGVETAIDGARRTARRVIAHYGINDGVHVTVHRAAPPHRGLGSGTQLALAVARAVTELCGLTRPVPELATVVGRARRSAIGSYVFAFGGCVLEGGRREGDTGPAPLLGRLPFPKEWRCVAATAAQPGLSGEAEDQAFAKLPPPDPHDAERVAHLVLTALWPALAEGDFATFSAALMELQQINGSWFAPMQGGEFSAGVSASLIKTLVSWGATGVGQSSWGPTVYALAPDPDAGTALATRVREWLERHGGGDVYEGPFSATGASFWRR
jgi:beta-ribofuranosylaminobenzene 5'-phosphate synthase